MGEKCRVSEDGKHIYPCKTLYESSEYGNPRGKQKGVFHWEYHTIESNGPVRGFYGVKSGEFVSKGMAFNYCPFCGEKIDAPFSTPDTK